METSPYYLQHVLTGELHDKVFATRQAALLYLTYFLECAEWKIITL